MNDKFSEECGIFGICNHIDAAKISIIGLNALQHRGQEAVGISAYNKQIKSQKKIGKILDNFDLNNLTLDGTSCIAHTRYSTCKAKNESSIQPLVNNSSEFAIAHNGQIFSTNDKISDSYQIIELMENEKKSGIEQAFVKAINNIKGGFAIICLYQNKILAARDNIGIRPLILGKLDNSYIFCSETCALEAVGAEFIREIENGEIIICDNNEIKQLQKPAKNPAQLCIFEYIYFARSDSYIKNHSVYSIRKKMGKILAQEFTVKADIVVPIQNSGTTAALGYAQQSNIPFELAIATNNYIGRSFIYPNENLRKEACKLKYSVIKNYVKNKDIILIDDSIVRGITIKEIIKLLKKAEVNKIHLCIASPMFKYADFFGIDIKQQSELLAHKYPNIEDMRKYLDVDSLYFLSINGLYQAIEGKNRNEKTPQYTDHYFTGKYPLLVTNED